MKIKLPQRKRKISPNILEKLIPLTLLGLLVGVGGVWVIRNYITDNSIILLVYIMIFLLIFQSKFIEIVKGPQYYTEIREESRKKRQETRKKYGGKPRR
ncbi:MAG: hypothetical protein ACXQTP_00205 [Candidatus Methanofastidiosia archaeon]